MNYKKLVQEQTGISLREQRKDKEKMNDSTTNEQQQQRQKQQQGMLETNGGGGHMANVIKRIEALYQGGVRNGDDSSDEEDEESSDEEDEDEDNEDESDEETNEDGTTKERTAIDGDEDEDEDDDDEDEEDVSSGSEMEDDHPIHTPGGTVVPKENNNNKKKDKTGKKEGGDGGGSDPGSDEKQRPILLKKKKSKKKDKGKKRRRGDNDWYDVEDDWIDDEELDEYFDQDGRKTKHGGFFVNKGEIQNVNEDGTTPVKGQILTYKERQRVEEEAAAGRGRRIRRGYTLGTVWTEPLCELLKLAVEEYGHNWVKIAHEANSGNEKYAALIGIEKNKMQKKWASIRQEMLANNMEPPDPERVVIDNIGKSGRPPGRPPAAVEYFSPEDCNDQELLAICAKIEKIKSIVKGTTKDLDNSVGLLDAQKQLKRDVLDAAIEEFALRLPHKYFVPHLSKAVVVDMMERLDNMWSEKTVRDKLNKYYRQANPTSSDLALNGNEELHGGGLSSPAANRSTRATPTKTPSRLGSTVPSPGGLGRSPLAFKAGSTQSEDWMTDEWNQNFAEFQRLVEINHMTAQRSGQPDRFFFSTESTAAFLKLIRAKLLGPGPGPKRGLTSAGAYEAALRAIPSQYGLTIESMKNKYSNAKAEEKKKEEKGGY